MSQDVTVRNEYGARIRGGPAGRTIYPDEEVTLPESIADYYVETYGFSVVGSDDAADAGDEAGDDTDADAGDEAGTDTEFTDADVDFADASYRELQTAAEAYDDVPGNLSTEDLRAALQAKTEADE